MSDWGAWGECDVSSEPQWLKKNSFEHLRCGAGQQLRERKIVQCPGAPKVLGLLARNPSKGGFGCTAALPGPMECTTSHERSGA